MWREIFIGSGELQRLARRCSSLLAVALWLLCVNESLAEEQQTYRTIEWVDLIPAADLEALLNPPDLIGEIIDGSAGDRMPGDDERPDFGDSAQAQRYEAALRSTAVRPEFNGAKVRIPGFIVPLDFDETQMVSAFFLVPYFGACLHNPPPPPNQIIYSQFEGGLSLDDIYDPFWLEGTLTVDTQTNELGVAAYSMKTDRVTRYEWNDE
jgi:hypothetical protein